MSMLTVLMLSSWVFVKVFSSNRSVDEVCTPLTHESSRVVSNEMPHDKIIWQRWFV